MIKQKLNYFYLGKLQIYNTLFFVFFFKPSIIIIFKFSCPLKTINIMQAFIQLLSYKLRSKGKKILLVVHYKNKRENYHCVIIFSSLLSMHMQLVIVKDRWHPLKQAKQVYLLFSTINTAKTAFAHHHIVVIMF